MQYFKENSTEDPWGGCQTGPDDTNPDYDCHTYLEYNETVMDYEVGFDWPSINGKICPK